MMAISLQNPLDLLSFFLFFGKMLTVVDDVRPGLFVVWEDGDNSLLTPLSMP